MLFFKLFLLFFNSNPQCNFAFTILLNTLTCDFLSLFRYVIKNLSRFSALKRRDSTSSNLLTKQFVSFFSLLGSKMTRPLDPGRTAQESRFSCTFAIKWIFIIQVHSCTSVTGTAAVQHHEINPTFQHSLNCSLISENIMPELHHM